MKDGMHHHPKSQSETRDCLFKTSSQFWSKMVLEWPTSDYSTILQWSAILRTKEPYDLPYSNPEFKGKR